jgi:hypothetical protein
LPHLLPKQTGEVVLAELHLIGQPIQAERSFQVLLDEYDDAPNSLGQPRDVRTSGVAFFCYTPSDSTGWPARKNTGCEERAIQFADESLGHDGGL